MQYSYILWAGPGSVPSRFDLNLKLLLSPKLLLLTWPRRGPFLEKEILT